MRNSSILLGGGTITAIRPTLDSRPESIVLVLHSWNNGVDCTHGGVPDRKFGVSPSSSFFSSLPSLFFFSRQTTVWVSVEWETSRVDILDGNRLSVFHLFLVYASPFWFLWRLALLLLTARVSRWADSSWDISWAPAAANKMASSGGKH